MRSASVITIRLAGEKPGAARGPAFRSRVASTLASSVSGEVVERVGVGAACLFDRDMSVPFLVVR
jgi:hypothetical protein